ncbi:putative mitochondrial L-2-hydroxyglutarate dehydrogenase [Rhypophila decipiens]|uniref:L-2-hydroxyglutarate dehydrogenase, mitochondrial n=1 Tax=Rhypophila decipiens TaxID=261697 RepID=A0AAN6YCR3_9PEZI|nr:putative mitochondrial L-2-hydroxyglutarate dehydrogenase [Rhypophila decipiens]
MKAPARASVYHALCAPSPTVRSHRPSAATAVFLTVHSKFPQNGNPRRLFSHTPRAQADFTHAVIGAGVVGLAVAQELARRSGSPGSTVLLERHNAIGTETSSRNSEVIHAGIYYGASSLKTSLCLHGKHLLYSLCSSRGIPHRRTGKWIVAQNDIQLAALEQIHSFCTSEINVPVNWVSLDEASRREPAVHAEKAILESPTTGIIDSHAYMLSLLGLFEEAGGTLALNSAVQSVTPLSGSSPVPGSAGWELVVRDPSTGEESTITAETIINSAGLGAVDIHNMIVPKDQHKKMYYAKGNYFSYPASQPKVNTLIYPAPEPGHGGLGTHLTLDLAGRIKFGPDVEWVDSPDDLAVNTTRLPQTIAEVKKYLPTLDETQLQPDYAGIRPKLAKAGAVAHGKGFVDFVIRKEDGYEGWINLLNIESPGLTSSLAISEKVRQLLYT